LYEEVVATHELHHVLVSALLAKVIALQQAKRV
jgi:hypothetical protein